MKRFVIEGMSSDRETGMMDDQSASAEPMDAMESPAAAESDGQPR